MIHLEVAVAAPLEQTLTYSLPETAELEGSVDSHHCYVGRRVLVWLGKRRVTGYVLDVVTLSEEPSFKIRAISRFLDEYPLFHENSVEFYRWVANYYHYPLGLVIKTALPGGLAPKSAKKLVLKTSPDEFLALFEDEIPSWSRKISSQGELGAQETAEVLSTGKAKSLVARLAEKDAVSIEYIVAKDGVREKTEICYAVSGLSDFTLKEIDTGQQKIKKYQQQISREAGIDLKLSEVKALYSLQNLTQKNNRNTIALKDIRKDYSGASKALIALEEKQLVVRSLERVFRSPFGEQLKHYPRPDSLTDEQQAVLENISPAIRAKEFSPFLLHGVTGCGKTEVYLRAAEETLALGRDVIILVPEIALATQLEAHLLSRFGNLVVLLHSGMSPAERFDQFYLALTGKAKVVIGARSALFAPFRDPGLIVVDEEHDASFKQDDSFRYHGRDLAVLRAKHHEAVVILGSATPSITSYAHAQSGKYTLLTMKDRVGLRSLPSVTIVDLNKKQAKDTKGIIKKELHEKLTNNLKIGKQSILLLNRRGFSAVVLCRDCGTPVQCTHCHVSLTLHKGKNRLVCHYCGFSAGYDTACLECRSTDLVPAGFGTERVEEEVLDLFPEARIKRIDSDTASDRKKFLSTLAKMHAGEIDILIGTQMIAKGHHFPNVTLVGVVWADGGMSMPDFRAAERTFQLITQVIGRAGRGDEPGEVIIQTMRPDHYAILYSRDHQYGKMFDHEMRLRQHPAFPPYLRLTALRLQGRVENDVQQTAVTIARYSRETVKKEKFKIETLGPAPSPLDKIKDNYRWQILLKGKNTSEMHALCTAIKSARQELVGRNCTLAIDVDPENMM
ncbi:MAG: primosomal protein N' [Desulfobulbaceae bacterium]|nr:primosomal protein N' [Desulfobulbaceae bacterium]